MELDELKATQEALLEACKRLVKVECKNREFPCEGCVCEGLVYCFDSKKMADELIKRARREYET